MWPLVAWLLLYPLTVPLAEWLTRLAGRVPGDPTRGAVLTSLAVYFATAAVLAASGVLRILA